MCQRYIVPSQMTIAVTGLASGPRARSMPMSRRVTGRMHHAREREQQEQRRDVAEQHVLEHVRGEEVLLTERRRWARRARRAARASPPAKASACSARRAPRPAGLAPRLQEAPDVDDRRAARSARGRPGRPASECAGAPPSRDCRNAVPTRRNGRILGRWRRGASGSLGATARRRRCCWALRRGRWPVGPRRGDPLCGGCRALAAPPRARAGVALRRPVWAPLAYAGPARDLVRALKFRGAIALADAMAAQIVANAPPGRRSLAGGTLVPVPLHPRRLRSRGYNQAALIADAVGDRDRAAGARLPAPRPGPSVTQVGRDRAERRAGPGRWGRTSLARPPEQRAPRRRRRHHRRHARAPARDALARPAGSTRSRRCASRGRSGAEA